LYWYFQQNQCLKIKNYAVYNIRRLAWGSFAILLTRRPWPYVIHHLHFMNIYRLYIAWYRPILLMYVGCINWYFRNKTIKLNIYFLYWYFQQNQCLKLKNYAVYNMHRLAWGLFACGTTGQLSIVPIHKYISAVHSMV
jgi:hypothetical protein